MTDFYVGRISKVFSTGTERTDVLVTGVRNYGHSAVEGAVKVPIALLPEHIQHKLANGAQWYDVNRETLKVFMTQVSLNSEEASSVQISDLPVEYYRGSGRGITVPFESTENERSARYAQSLHLLPEGFEEHKAKTKKPAQTGHPFMHN